MIFTGSLAVVLGFVIFTLLRNKVLKAFDLILCGAFGFLLADSGAAVVISEALAWLAKTAAAIHP